MNKNSAMLLQSEFHPIIFCTAEQGRSSKAIEWSLLQKFSYYLLAFRDAFTWKIGSEIIIFHLFLQGN